MKPPIRLLAIDIDGTLLDSHFQISPADLAALRRAHQAGVDILLATGRRHQFAMPIAALLGFPVWLVSSNGAVTRSSTGELFHRDVLPRATAARLLDHMLDFRHHAVLTFDREDQRALALEGLDRLNASIARWLEKNMQFITIIQPLRDALTEDPIQAMFAGDIAHMQQAIDHIGRAPFLSELTVLKTQYEARDLCIVDVLIRDCSKGHAVERWAEQKRIPREAIMAIGDNFNDIEMLQVAGRPYLMANACDELKQRGWPITLSNEDSGVAAALHHVFDGEPIPEPAAR